MHRDARVHARKIRPAVAAVVEQMERRALLAVTAAEYDSIRGTYADFELPADMGQINIIEITPDQLGVGGLKSAITTAGTTALPDLVVLRTTDTQNTITYTDVANEMRIDIPAAQGALTIVSLGSRPLTLDAAGECGVLRMGGLGIASTANLGGMVLTNGKVSGFAGGITQHDGTLRLTNVTITGNTGSHGGGVYQSGGALTLTNVIITGNTALYGEGGGMYQYYGTSQLTNVTISGNRADSGGGLHLEFATSTLRNTIVARNSAPTAPDVYAYSSAVSSASNLIGDGTGQGALVHGMDGNLVGTSTNPINPLLAEGSSLGLGLMPVEGSPVVDAGDDSLIPSGVTTDARGAVRIQGARVNIGAVETVLPFMAGVSYVVTSLEDNVADDGVLTLREALAAANTNQPAGDAPAGSYSSPDRVEFAPGLVGTILTHGQAYQILGSLDLLGPGARQLTLDAGGQGSVVEVVGTGYAVNLRGLRLIGGNAQAGGGLSSVGVQVTLANMVISGNSATDGGGLYQRSGALALTNVVIADNMASSIGGGVYQEADTLTLTNVTISGNTAAGACGGVHLSSGSTLWMSNSIIARNTASSYPDVYRYGGTISGLNNLIGDGTGLTLMLNGVNGNLIGTSANPIDPLLAEGNTSGLGLSPLPGSPVIDAGDNSFVPFEMTTDVYGAARIQGTRVNIGAVETVLDARASVTYVVTSLEDGVAADGVVTLREALAAANSNQTVGDAPAGSYSAADRIEFAPVLTGTILTHGQPYQILGSLEVVGPGADQLTLDAGGSSTVLEVRGAAYTVSLHGLGLTGGNATDDNGLPGNGSGLSTAGATLALQDMLISGNTASDGGGIYQSGGAITLTNVTISGNSASSGGGLYQHYGTSTLTDVTISANAASSFGGGVYDYYGISTLSNVTISENIASSGGGVYQSGGTMTLTNVAVNANSAFASGGGFYQIYGTATLTSVTISGNTASNGGGAYRGEGTLTLTNTTISGNAASSAGGGVYQSSGTLTFANVTVARNTALSAGAGLYQYGGTATLKNSIVARNLSSAGPDIYRFSGTLSGANNVIGNGAGQASLLNGVNGNLVGTSGSPIDPLLAEGSTSGIAFAPVEGSPAIDAGDNSLVPSGISVDLYGAPRIQGARVNIGAVETVLPAMAGVSYVVTSLEDSVANDGVLTLREALAAANTNKPIGDAPAGSYSSPDRVEFAPGLTGTILTHGQAYQILGSLEIIGPGADQLILDAGGSLELAGAGADQLILIAGGSGNVVEVRGVGYAVNLRGLKLTRGNAASGGGLFSVGAQVTLEDLEVVGNTASAGGGIYQYSGTLTLTNAIISGNTASGTPWDAHHGGGIFLEHSNSTLTNVVISGNAASGSNGGGGGVYQDDGTLTLTNVTLSNNDGSSSGGGLYQYYGTSTLRAVMINGNTARSYGGGVYQSYGTSMLADVTISGNAATYGRGGGIYQTRATSTLANSLISANTAIYGGGVCLYNGTSTLTGVTIGGNSASNGQGGGVYQYSGMSTLINVTISGNSATGSFGGSGGGGGVYLSSGVAELTNATISGNSASQSGGGAYLGSGAATLRNTIVARNTAGYGPDLFRGSGTLAGSNNLIGNGTGQTSLVSGANGNLVGTAVSPLDPRFVSMAGTDWAQWNLRLTASSPAVNSGSNALIPAGITTDITGGPRIIGGTVDMGAYEFDPPPTITSISINDGTAQRSMVKQLAVTFSEPVVLSADALQVKLGDGTLPPSTTVTVSNPSGDQQSYILSFSGSAVVGGSLADGTYDLIVSATGVQDLAGNALTADYSQRFHRLFGDSDGNKVVNALDYARLKNTLGRAPADPLFNSAFDYEANNLINALDLARFRQRYGLSFSY